MKNKRRIHSAEFKARIALEAIKGLKFQRQLKRQKRPIYSVMSQPCFPFSQLTLYRSVVRFGCLWLEDLVGEI